MVVAPEEAPFIDLVQVRAGGAFGTGLLIAPGIVLTALHLVWDSAQVGGRRDRLGIYLLRDLQNPTVGERHLDARVVWPNLETLSENPADVAVLEVLGTAPPLPSVVHRFGELPQTPTMGSARGFPACTKGAKLPGGRIERDQPGRVTYSSRTRRALTIDATGPHELEGLKRWGGLSGGPLFAGGLIVGVMREVPNGWKGEEIEAEPLAPLIRQHTALRYLLGVTLPLLSSSAPAQAGSLMPLAGTLSPRFTRRLHRYSEFYLGTEINPAPFGGRAAQLSALDRWLNDNEAPRRLLLWALAGRGKSALLAHWVARHASTEAIVFVPISIRFGTADELTFHQLFANQLAAVLGECILTPPDAKALAQYKEWCLDYLYRLREVGRSVLIVLDGLDEATGWSIGPELLPDLPACVRVVASARLQRDDNDARGWRVRLGWPARLAADMEVPPLDLAGVHEAMVSMGAPLDRLRDPAPVARELLRLTEGDPLLLGFYVEDLWGDPRTSIRLRPKDLQHLEKGFAAYFRDWLKKQEAPWRSDTPRVNAVLQILAVAIGPLPHADLADLVRRRLGDDKADVSEQTLEPLQRFLIGDPEYGYVFSHPRLGFHLRDDHFRDRNMAKQVDQAFADWGLNAVAAVNSGRLAPEAVSRYLLRHLSTHLSRIPVTAEHFMSLLENGWRLAWLAFDGGDRGFALDVQRCAEALPKVGTADQPVLAWGIRCALVLSSIASAGRNIPPELLAAAVRVGLMPALQALHLLEYQDNNGKSSGLVALSPFIPEALLPEALIAARAIGEERFRAKALAAMAERLPELWREVQVSARAIKDNVSRAEALIAMAEHLPEAWPEALAAIGVIWLASERAKALVALAPRLPARLLPEALVTARAIEHELPRADALMALTPRLPAELLPVTLAAVRAIEYEYPRAKALVVLAQRLPEIWPEALAVTRTIGNKVQRVEMRAALVQCLPTELLSEELQPEGLVEARAVEQELPRAKVLAGQLSEAFVTALSVRDERARTKALAALAAQLPDMLLPEALAAAGAIQGEQPRAAALSALASRLPAALLPAALAAARAIGDDAPRAAALMALAPHLPAEILADVGRARRDRSGAETLFAMAPDLPDALIPEALAGAGTIGDDHVCAQLLVTLAPRLRDTQLQQALAVARIIGKDRPRAAALSALAPHLTDALLQELLADAGAISDDRGRAALLGILTPRLVDALLPQALIAARAIGDDAPRAEVLIALTARLPKALLPQVLAAARTMKDTISRAAILAAVAGRMPEVLQEARAAANIISHERVRAESLAALAEHMPEVWPDAMGAIRAIQRDSNRARVLVTLAPRLPSALLEAALTAACTIADENCRAEALTALAPRLPDALRSKALAAARAILYAAAGAVGGKLVRAEALVPLAERLPEALLPEILAVVRDIEYILPRAKVLVAVAPRLPEALLPEALAIARAIGYDSPRTKALVALASRLPAALPEALLAARASGDERVCAEALAALTMLAPRLPEAALSQSLATVRTIVGADRSRAEALSGLVPRLPATMLPEALAAARGIGNVHARARALAAVATHVIKQRAAWAEVLHVLIGEIARLRRHELLLFVTDLLNNREQSFEGDLALTEVLRAIHDTATWYP